MKTREFEEKAHEDTEKSKGNRDNLRKMPTGNSIRNGGPRRHGNLRKRSMGGHRKRGNLTQRGDIAHEAQVDLHLPVERRRQGRTSKSGVNALSKIRQTSH